MLEQRTKKCFKKEREKTEMHVWCVHACESESVFCDVFTGTSIMIVVMCL